MIEADIWVVIPAAGVGARMQADRPKQYLALRGQTVLEQTLAIFAAHPRVAGIVLAVSLDDAYWPDVHLSCNKPLHLVPGGDERVHSVAQALGFLVNMLGSERADSSWVMVHDAARPCLRRSDLDALLAALEHDATGGLLAMRVRDTMKRADAHGQVMHTEPREDLWHALTPQMFRLGVLHDAMQKALQDGVQLTDESSAMEYAGFKPRLVEGHADNIKITRAEDLAQAEWILAQREVMG